MERIPMHFLGDILDIFLSNAILYLEDGNLFFVRKQNNNTFLQGRVKFPIGGKVRERICAGSGEIPEPTV